jgi:two-component system LytT family response regulator
MIKVLVLDDDQNAIDSLKSLIEENIPQVDSVFATTNISSAQNYLNENKPQLIFLDVEMPVMSGFDFLSKQKNKNFDVIFSTAFSKYAIQAIRFSALDFLLKPIQTDELLEAFNRFLNQPVAMEQKLSMYENLFHNLQTKNEADFKLSVTKGNRTYFISPSEIYYCSAFSNYTNFYLRDSAEFTVAKTLKEFEEMLNAHKFIRTHKSFLVNSFHVHSFNSDGNLILKNNTIVEVSRRRESVVKRSLGVK